MKGRLYTFMLGAAMYGIFMGTYIAFAQPPIPTPIYEPQPTDTYGLGPCVSLFNGESGVVSGEHYAIVEHAAHTGTLGAVTTGTTQKVPRIKHGRLNLTIFNEVWMWMRCSVPSPVGIKGRAYISSRTPQLTDTQTYTPTIGTEWELVRIDLKAIDQEALALPSITEWIISPAVVNGVLTQVQIDDVWAVKLLPPSDPTEPTPDPGTDPAPDPEPDPTPVVYGDWIRQPIETAIVSRRVGSNGTEQFYTVPVTITFGEPVLVTTPAPGVQP